MYLVDRMNVYLVQVGWSEGIMCFDLLRYLGLSDHGHIFRVLVTCRSADGNSHHTVETST